MEDRTPFFLQLKIDEILGVEKSGSVGAVVGTTDLTCDLGDFGERSEDDTGAIHDIDTHGGASTRRESSAHPNCAFIKVG